MLELCTETHLSAENADKLRGALGGVAQGKSVLALWIFDAASEHGMSRENANIAARKAGFKPTKKLLDKVYKANAKLTKLEAAIIEVLAPKKEHSTTAHMLKPSLRKYGFSYGPEGKQVIGMAIGRMKKKGISANYAALK